MSDSASRSTALGEVRPTAVEVAAARLLVRLDELDGLETDELIRRVALGGPISSYADLAAAADAARG